MQMKTLLSIILLATFMFPSVAEATNKDKIHPYMNKNYKIQKEVKKPQQKKVAKAIAKGKKVCHYAIDRKTKQNVLICE